MFIVPSSLTTLNYILTLYGSIPGNIHSATTYPLPDVLPLSTPLAPPLNQSSTSPSSHSYFLPGSRSPPSSGLSSSMPPPNAPGYLGEIGIVILSSQSIHSVSVSSDSLRPTVRTSTGTSLPSPSPFSSNPDVSASLTSPPAMPSTISAFLSTIPSSPSSSLFTDSLSMSGSISIPTFTYPFPTTFTRTFSATASLSYSSSSTSSPSALSSAPATDKSSDTPSSITTVVLSSTLLTSVSSPSSSSHNSPSVSTYTITSIVLPVGQGGTVTDFVTTSSILSTEPPGSSVNGTAPLSPGTIAAIVLGIVGAFAFSALWLFCARRRHHRLVQEAALLSSQNHASGPLDDEIPDLEVLTRGIESIHSTEDPTHQTGSPMEERYAGILAALHFTQRFGRDNEGGSTGAIYGSRHDTATDMGDEGDIARASSPTLPLHVLPPDDPPYVVPLAPPLPASQSCYYQTAQPAPPPSSYYMAARRKSSPGPDAAAWLGGYSVAPSCNSYYARSQTLGSGSGSGSVDALSRTRTGSEDPLLGIGKVAPEISAGASTPVGVSPTATIDPGGNRPRLGSAFGSPATSMYSPSSVYPTLQHDTSGSYGTRSVSGSGSHGYPRSGTPSSFDVLQSVSSQGALSSAYSQGHGQSQGFRFGFNRQSSSSSDSTGKKTGTNRHTFGVPPTSFKAWKDRGSSSSDKEKRNEKQSLREKDWKTRPRNSSSSASAAESVDEKQGKASPVGGVRALLGRLRLAGHTPSPHSSNRDLSSPTKAFMDVDSEKIAANRTTPPPIQIEAATPQRRRFSFILSNPDPHPPSPYSGAGDVMPSDTPPYQSRHMQYGVPKSEQNDDVPVPLNAGGLQPAMPFPTRYVLGSTPSPAPTEESRLVEGLLHPRLQNQGCSDASLRDFEDYSRPIGGVVKNRLYSTTTFGTQDEIDQSPGRGTLVQEVLSGDDHACENELADVFGTSRLRGIPRENQFADNPSPPMTARDSPVGA